MPLSFPVFIFTPPGSSEPSFAIGTRSPTFTLSAPVTICSFSVPTSTFVTINLSASGCFVISNILPTTTFFISFPFCSIVSTFEPVIVNLSANVCTSTLTSA